MTQIPRDQIFHSFRAPVDVSRVNVDAKLQDKCERVAIQEWEKLPHSARGYSIAFRRYRQGAPFHQVVIMTNRANHTRRSEHSARSIYNIGCPNVWVWRPPGSFYELVVNLSVERCSQKSISRLGS